LKTNATFQIYTVILDITQFDIDNPWPRLFSVGGHMCGLRWQYDCVAHVVSCPTALVILRT